MVPGLVNPTRVTYCSTVRVLDVVMTKGLIFGFLIATPKEKFEEGS